MPDARVTLNVGGRRYGGWKSARIVRSLEAISGAFELGITERWAGRGEPWPIGEGDACELAVNGTTVITGHIDARDRSFAPGSYSVAVRGRDRTGDLVDSSVNLGKWEFAGVDVLTFAQRICEPHGIAVRLQSGIALGPAPAKLSIDPGDKGQAVLEAACRSAGLLPVSDGVGGLVLSRAGRERCASELVEGENLLSGSASFSLADRFRTYRVLAQHHGKDNASGKTAASPAGSAEDLGVTRSARALIVRGEGSLTATAAKARAEWEAATRAARGDTVTVTVQGWTQADGALWPINHLARVRAPRLGVDGELLIVQTVFALTVEGGATTEITLRRPDAFLPEPQVPADGTGAAGGDRYWKEIRRGALT